MIRVKIKNLRTSEFENSGNFASIEIAQDWIDRKSSQGVFGKLERIVPQSVCSEEELSEALELFPEVIDETGFISPALARLPQTFEVIVEDITAQVAQEKINEEALKFLNGTDWKVIRHKDQLELGINTSLSHEEYTALLLERQAARSRVV